MVLRARRATRQYAPVPLEHVFLWTSWDLLDSRFFEMLPVLRHTPLLMAFPNLVRDI